MDRYMWNLCTTDGSDVTAFAAAEFARLIVRMDPAAEAAVQRRDFDPAVRALWIGLQPAPEAAPDVEDPETDDAYRIRVENGAGVITGSNRRSVLLGVYRFFREAGCVFVRPGRDGESVPRRDSAGIRVSVCEKAAYRWRGICLEGSDSFENVSETIDWAPKQGFNVFYTQLFRPAFAFRRWYGHDGNPYLLPTPVSAETIDAFVADYDRQIALRGLIHQRIGHGWASKVLGITSGAWHEKNREEEVDADRRELIALIGGERKLFEGSGIDTNLCYSDPRVQELLAEEVVRYAKEHPQTSCLHFWLADRANNQCECERCRGGRPSDQYVELLNRIDAGLTEAGLPVRIVFLIYLDLLWEPVRNRLNDPDRFILMFAPIRRSYSVPMAEDSGYAEAPFVRNGFVLPREAGGSLPYLAAWQKVFDGDSFVFDYHYMWDYLNDPGGWECVRILEQDVGNLRELGLNGMMSCQNLRVFMPSGFGMDLLGAALWSGETAFEAQAERFFSAAYGADGTEYARFLRELSRLFDPPTLRGEKPVRSPECVRRCRMIPERIDAFLPVIGRNLPQTDPVWQRSWEIADFHARLCRALAGVMLAAAEGDEKALDGRWSAVRETVCRNEMRFQREFDVFEFLNVWENKILPVFKKQVETFVE